MTKPRKYDKRTIFIPRESPRGLLRTSDGASYWRDQETGVIRSLHPKARGKVARRADKKARRGKNDV